MQLITTQQQQNRAVLLGAEVDDRSWSATESLAELSRLADTAGIEVVGEVMQRLRSPQPRSYLGKGKIREVKEQKSDLRFDTVIADDELSPSQQRYLEDVLDVEVLDRTAVILYIFAQHARSREGRLQVELAQYRYRLPRLTGRGTELSRLGGRLSSDIMSRGPGETKLEVDRRRIRQRIAELGREIEQVRKIRGVHRRQRRSTGVPVIALVGYTNAGKSTLMNVLTGAEVLSTDSLFATLDPTTRRLELPNGQEVLLTDTVGFIQKLPTDLIAAFRATLEEIQEADVVMHVVDASHPQAEQQAEAVEDELDDLGVGERPRLVVLNKIDLVRPERLPVLGRMFPDAALISAQEGTGLDQLRRHLVEAIAKQFVAVRVEIPYAAAELVNLFRARGMVEREDHLANGTLIVGKLPPALLPSFQRFLS